MAIKHLRITENHNYYRIMSMRNRIDRIRKYQYFKICKGVVSVGFYFSVTCNYQALCYIFEYFDRFFDNGASFGLARDMVLGHYL